MAFINSGKNLNNQYNENGEKLITLRLSIENSLRFIVYSTVPNIFVKKKNMTNLEKLLDLININTSYTEEDVDARQYFLALHVIVGKVNRGEVSTLEVLSDSLLTEHGDKDISSNNIHQIMATIDMALAMEEDDNSDAYLVESEVLEMNKFVETRISYSFLNQNLDGLKNLTRDLAEGKISDNRVVETAEGLITDLHSQLVKTKTSSDIEDNTLNFASRDDSENAVSRYITQLRSPENKLRTGYKALNRMLNGGLQEQRLYVFLGTPKSFKSGTLLNIALTAAKYNTVGKRKTKNRKPVVLYYSMENDSIETLDRIFFHSYGKSIADSDMTKEQIIESIYQATHNESGVGVIIKYAPSNSVNTDHLYDTINELREDGFETVLLVQDYLRRIRSSKIEQEHRLTLGNIADELSIIAKTENIPVVTASQLNREATNIREHCIKQGVMDIASQMFISHIAESVQIQQNMDYGIIVAREEVIKYDEMGNKSSSSYLGFKLVASRDRQLEDENGNKLEYFAMPFENGFKIAEDEDTDSELWSESVARAAMSDDEYDEMEQRKQKINEKMNNNYKNRNSPVMSMDQRAPNMRSTARQSIGRSTENLNRDKLQNSLRPLLDPMNDL